MENTKEYLCSLVFEFIDKRSNVSMDRKEFNESLPLFDQGMLDSVGFVQLCAFLAEKTNIDPDFVSLDISQLGTVGNLIDLYS